MMLFMIITWKKISACQTSCQAFSPRITLLVDCSVLRVQGHCRTLTLTTNLDMIIAANSMHCSLSVYHVTIVRGLLWILLICSSASDDRIDVRNAGDLYLIIGVSFLWLLWLCFW